LDRRGAAWTAEFLMGRLSKQPEQHVVARLGWLRAAVLGANDGILSTSSLIIGVASAQGSREGVLVAGVSGLVAGAMSMAAGEYVSVSSQADSEGAELARERQELGANRDAELRELAGIYVKRGLGEKLALQVADQLMAHDALSAHARDELGLTDTTAARPVQAGLASAGAFSVGALLPLLVAVATPTGLVVRAVAVSSLLFLALLGVLGARLGRADMLKAALRVTFWGVLAMAVAALVGALFGTRVAP
jgi:VIT1/CCC1 family predicted Fe2+/Mn2+ transporter